MAKGRPPKPVKLKLIQGTYRADRHPDNEMAPAVYKGLPGPPELLQEYETACELWKEKTRWLHSMGMLHEMDFPEIAAYCINMADYWELREDIRINGREFMTPKGFEQKRPAVNMAKEALELALKIGSTFGFNLSARSKISAPGQDEEDDLDKILNR
jgi:P27 family predicted phage terminase small subunit